MQTELINSLFLDSYSRLWGLNLQNLNSMLVGDWVKRITRIYVIVSAFQSWPFPVCSQAAHYGCGCWAENACNMNPYSTAVSTSGIPRTLSILLTAVSLPVQLWVPFFLFRFPNQLETDSRCELLMKRASKSLRILSDGQPFLPSDSHHSFARLIESWVSGLC